MQGIYKIVNLVNNKVYIGQSCDLDIRKKSHFGQLRRGCHINKHLQNSWNKYGEDKFSFEIIESYEQEVSSFYLTKREQYWIDYYGGLNPTNTYNNRDAGNKGHLSERSKQLVSLHNKGKKVIITKETKQKISYSLKGRPAHNKGISPSNETRYKISQSLKGRKKGPMTEETKKKLSQSHKGKPAWNKGIPNTHKGEHWDIDKKIKSRTLHAHLRGYKVAQYKSTGELIGEYESTMEAERKTGICNSNIGACCRGIQKTAGGYIWKKLD